MKVVGGFSFNLRDLTVSSLLSDSAFDFALLSKMEESSENQNAKCTKRQWTTEEDAILVQGLLQLVDDGWKADAGTFKPGYTKVLEKYLHKKIPNCTLKANPHIESRVKRLKAQYSAIKDMLGPSASGFGWDDTRKMIVVEKEVFNQWCKSHHTAIGLYGKPFPHFDSLDVVFGKDKASGGMSEGPADHAYNMVREFFQSTQGNESGFNLNEDGENFESQIPETPTSNTTQAPSPINQPQSDATAYKTGKRGGKRVKYNDDVSDSLLTSVNKLGDFYAGTMENIQQLTSCFLHERHTAERTAEKRNQIVPMLKEIEGLSAVDVVRASVMLTKDNNLCDCFFAMDTPELRKEFVYIVLNNNGAS